MLMMTWHMWLVTMSESLCMQPCRESQLGIPTDSEASQAQQMALPDQPRLQVGCFMLLDECNWMQTYQSVWCVATSTQKQHHHSVIRGVTGSSGV